MAILHGVVVSDEPTDTFIILARLLVCKRFHRIAETLLYRCSKFEFGLFCSDFYLDLFVSSLSNHAYKSITCLRMHWGPYMNNSDSCMFMITSCHGLVLLELLHFPTNIDMAQLRQLLDLPVKEIRFKSEHYPSVKKQFDTLLLDYMIHTGNLSHESYFKAAQGSYISPIEY